MSNFFNFFKEYSENLNNCLLNINEKKISQIFGIIDEAIKYKKNIFTCGNGGSASVSNHLLCDFNKGIKQSSKNKKKPKVISLSSNIEIITAISNDLNYSDVFVYQLENYAKSDDVLIAFSCSGSSKNIIKAVRWANKNKLKTIGFLGFAYKNNENLYDYSVNIKFKNYGITEDVFQILMHAISQYIRKKSIKNFKKNKNIL